MFKVKNGDIATDTFLQQTQTQYRSSRPEVFYKKGVLIEIL